MIETELSRGFSILWLISWWQLTLMGPSLPQVNCSEYTMALKTESGPDDRVQPS